MRTSELEHDPEKNAGSRFGVDEDVKVAGNDHRHPAESFDRLSANGSSDPSCPLALKNRDPFRPIRSAGTSSRVLRRRRVCTAYAAKLDRSCAAQRRSMQVTTQ